MTTIVFHGLLAQKFGKKIKLKLGRLVDFALAVDAIRPGFRSFLLKLNKKNQDYSIHFEKNGTEIHLIPLISGSGRTLMMIIAIIIIVIACVVAWYLAPTWAGAASALLTGTMAGASTGAAIAIGAAAIAFQVGVSLLITALKMPTGPNSSSATGKAAMMSSGGSSSSINTAARSFVFDNLQNSATQGHSVPIGYGRMKIGSQLITVANKHFSLDQLFESEARIAQIGMVEL